MTEVLLPYGTSQVRLELPAGATVVRVGPGRAAEGAPSTLEAVVERALASPHGAPPLEIAARDERAATIAVSPEMPASWAAVVLRDVVARLARSGMPAAGVRVRIAREPSGAPGPATLEAHLRTSLPGFPVHRVGAPGDTESGPGLRVLAGFARPHPIAGWTGGGDLCTPGLLSEDDARAALRSTLDARVGPDGTPRSLRGSTSGPGFRGHSEGPDSGPTTGLAVVLGSDAAGAPVAAAGALRTAHDAVVRAIAPGRACAVPSPADLVVLGGGAPFDRDVPAASQALDLALALARPGTIVVWLAEAAEGAGPPTFLQWFEAGRLERHLAALRREFQSEGLVAYAIRATAARVPIYVVSREGVDLLRPMGLTPFADVQAAFDRAWGGRASGRVVVVESARRPCASGLSACASRAGRRRGGYGALASARAVPLRPPRSRLATRCCHGSSDPRRGPRMPTLRVAGRPMNGCTSPGIPRPSRIPPFPGGRTFREVDPNAMQRLKTPDHLGRPR